jgi:tight adherence protein B
VRRHLAVLGAALLVGAAAPAWAEGGSIRIVNVSTDNGQLQVVVAGSGTTKPISSSDITVTVDGKPVAATSKSVTAASVSRVAVLAIDTSGSTAGNGIVAARAAANAFLDAVPADVAVGLVSFADTARVLAQPTTARGGLRTAIRGLQPKGNTALYDAVGLALRTAGQADVRTVVVLTDGRDDGSRTSLASATNAVKASKVTVDAVALLTSVTDLNALRTLASAGHGQVRSATDGPALAKAFRTSAQDIANQVVLTAEIPDSVAGKSGTIEVVAGTLRDTAFVPFPAKSASGSDNGPRAVDVNDSFAGSTTWLLIAVLLLFAGIAVFITVGIVSAEPSGQAGRVRRRLSLYTLTGRAQPEREENTVLGDTALARSAVDFAGRLVSRRDFEATLQRKLDAAAVPLRPAEWLLLHVGLSIGLPMILLIATGGRIAPALLGLAFGVLGPLTYLVVKESRRTNSFLAMLPDTLQLISGSLSAGYSLPQALDIVVREGSPPISTEFNRALVDARLGVPVEEALDNVATRMKSTDFSWVVMAIRIQREVGGNLAEVLATVSETLRERERLRRQVKVLSAEGRLSAAVLGGLPPLFAIYLVLVRPEYIKPLYTDSLGILMLVTAVIVLGIGIMWLRKVVKVEV